MKFTKLFVLTAALGLFIACPAPAEKKADEGNDNKEAAEKKDADKPLAVVDRPESITALMKERGTQDEAEPELVVESPTDGATIDSSTVKIKVQVKGDVKQGKGDDGMGNHVHVILNNQPYAAHYMWDEGFELRNVPDGEHTLRMFASRPWHESYKNEKAFATIKFTVKGGAADETKPTTDASGNKMADAKKPAEGDKPAEGTEVEKTNAGDVDLSKPLLTYSRPKGDYKGTDAEAIMLDFWLSNAKLTGDGGDYKVQYVINDNPPQTIDKWAPVWLKGWKDGTNTVKLTLLDKDGNEVKNGGYNSTTREIKVSK